MAPIGDPGPSPEAGVWAEAEHAKGRWAGAVEAHRGAETTDGLANRIRTLATAAARQADAYRLGRGQGMRWQATDLAALWGGPDRPAELRSDAPGHGPAELWAAFEAALAELEDSVGNSDDIERVAVAYEAVAVAAGALAETLD